jgi:hypothetical protein
MKVWLALLIAYFASQILFDRVYQAHTLALHSPDIKYCTFVPMMSYGNFAKLPGFFETGGCCSWIEENNDTQCTHNFFLRK